MSIAYDLLAEARRLREELEDDLIVIEELAIPDKERARARLGLNLLLDDASSLLKRLKRAERCSKPG